MNSSFVSINEDLRHHILGFIQEKNWDSAEDLIRRSEDLLIENNPDERSPILHTAVQLGAPLSLIKRIHQAGSDAILSRDNNGNTALHLACILNHGKSEEVVKFLVEELVKYEDIECFFATNYSGKTVFDLLFKSIHSSTSRKCEIILDSLNHWFTQEDMCNKIPQHVLDSILKLPRVHSDLLQNPTLKKAMNSKFTNFSFLFIFMTDLYVQMILVTIFSFFIQRGPEKQPNGDLIINCFSPCVVWLLIREGVQLIHTSFFVFFTTVSNYFDLMEIWAVVYLIVNLSCEKQSLDTQKEQFVLLTGTFTVWVQLLFAIGKLVFDISVFNVAFIKVISRLTPFLLTTIVVVIAFAHMYHFAGPYDETICDIHTNPDLSIMTDDQFLNGAWACTRQNSYISALIMLLNSEWHFLENPKGVQSLLSIVYAFVLGVLLLNIIIALISIEFQDVILNSERAFWHSRYQSLCEADTIISFLGPLLTCGKKKKKTSISEYDEESESSIDDLMNKFPSFKNSFNKITKNPLCCVLFLPFKVLYKVVQYLRIIYILQKLAIVCVQCGVMLSLAVVIPTSFVAGLATFGLLWPKDIKAFLFFGQIENSSELNGNKKNNLIEVKGDRICNNSDKESDVLKKRIQELSHKVDTLVLENKQIQHRSEKEIEILSSKIDLLVQLQMQQNQLLLAKLSGLAPEPRQKQEESELELTEEKLAPSEEILSQAETSQTEEIETDNTQKERLEATETEVAETELAIPHSETTQMTQESTKTLPLYD